MEIGVPVWVLHAADGWVSAIIESKVSSKFHKRIVNNVMLDYIVIGSRSKGMVVILFVFA